VFVDALREFRDDISIPISCHSGDIDYHVILIELIHGGEVGRHH
jgi:hypothetical protein